MATILGAAKRLVTELEEAKTNQWEQNTAVVEFIVAMDSVLYRTARFSRSPSFRRLSSKTH